MDQLILICQKLNISADYLLFGDIKPASSQRVTEAEQAINRLSDQERQELMVFSLRTLGIAVQFCALIPEVKRDAAFVVKPEPCHHAL